MSQIAFIQPTPVLLDRMVVVEHVTRTIATRAQTTTILDDVTFSIPAQSLFAISGPSGSGKSTLLNLLTGIDHPTSGRIVFAETELRAKSEAVLMVADLAPDVILMDLVMPEMDGVQATRLVKAHSPHSQVLVLTSYHEDEQIFPAIRAGALSYLLKGMGLAELVEAVCKAARGEAVMHPQVAARLVQELNGMPQEIHQLYSTLSEREREVLHLIAAGCTNADIAERLVVSEQTVRSHVHNILGKLHVADRTQAAVYAWRSGVMDDA